jgi:hypothetical protein
MNIDHTTLDFAFQLALHFVFHFVSQIGYFTYRALFEPTFNRLGESIEDFFFGKGRFRKASADRDVAIRRSLGLVTDIRPIWTPKRPQIRPQERVSPRPRCPIPLRSRKRATRRRGRSIRRLRNRRRRPPRR